MELLQNAGRSTIFRGRNKKNKETKCHNEIFFEMHMLQNSMILENVSKVKLYEKVASTKHLRFKSKGESRKLEPEHSPVNPTNANEENEGVNEEMSRRTQRCSSSK